MSDATPTRAAWQVLPPLAQSDPRLTLDEGALVAASRNAFPVVAQARRRSDSTGLAVGGGIALLLGGLTFWSMSGHRAPVPSARYPMPVASPMAPGLPVTAPPPLAAPAPSVIFPHVPSVAQPAQVRPSAVPIMVYDASTLPATTSGTTAGGSVLGSAPSTARPATASGGSDNDQFAGRVGNEDVQTATAQRLANPSDTVTQGTLIPAVLETAINTDLPGYVRALVSKDVRSFDGTQVLIPRSSRLIGQYKSGLAAGQSRAYVIWTRLIRPDGASVALASPAVDFAGTSGLTGKVDGHFLQRFGSAILLSVVGGLTAASNAAVVVSGGQSAATVAAQRDTAIPPTIRVAQGQPIRVFTARDLDFSTVTPIVAAR